MLRRDYHGISIDEFTGKVLDEYKKNDITYKMLNNYTNSKRKVEHSIDLLYNKRVNQELTTEEFKTEYDNLKTKLKDINENIKQLEEKQKGKLPEKHLKQIIVDFKNGKEFDNEILKKLVHRVEFYEDKTVDITLNI